MTLQIVVFCYYSHFTQFVPNWGKLSPSTDRCVDTYWPQQLSANRFIYWYRCCTVDPAEGALTAVRTSCWEQSCLFSHQVWLSVNNKPVSVWLELPISETCVQRFLTSSPARPRCRSLSFEPNKFQRSVDEKQEELETRRTREHDAFARHPKVRGTDLQQRNADEDPRHQREVVLQPLLKLGHAAFNVDVVLLLGVLRAHKHVSFQISMSRVFDHDRNRNDL